MKKKTTVDKILIIFETSVIRNPDYPHKEINFGSVFESIKNYVIDNSFEQNVRFAVTKFSLDELIYGREAEYLKDYEVVKKFEGLPGVDFFKTDFDYFQYLKGRARLFVKNNNILVIPYPLKIRLYKILKRSLLKEKPFIQSQKHSDYGFKDTVIWESILGFNKIKKFQKVVLITNDGGFDSCVREFVDTHKCYFKIFKDHIPVIEEIKNSLIINHAIEKSLSYKIAQTAPGIELIELIDWQEDEEIKKFIESEYFSDSLKQFVIDNSGDAIAKEDVVFINPALSIKNKFIDDEAVGREVISEVSVRGEHKKILTILDDANGIENYEFYD